MRKNSINPHLWKAETRKCLTCSKEFRAVKDHKKRKQIYCSNECRAKKNPPISHICKYWGKEFMARKSQNKIYCNKECRDMHYRETHKGEKSHFWKGGKTKIQKLLRSSATYHEWRVAVFTRDNYTCQRCGLKSEKGIRVIIQAHHLEKLSKHPELALKVENGLTLCTDCHQEVHDGITLNHISTKATKIN